MTVLIILAIGTLNIACFFIGAKVGQQALNCEKIELPSVNPMKRIRTKQDRKKAEEEAERLETVMRNIESYDGTGKGQKDV